MIGTLGAPFPDAVTFGILAIYATCAALGVYALIRRYREGVK